MGDLVGDASRLAVAAGSAHPSSDLSLSAKAHLLPQGEKGRKLQALAFYCLRDHSAAARPSGVSARALGSPGAVSTERSGKAAMRRPEKSSRRTTRPRSSK